MMSCTSIGSAPFSGLRLPAHRVPACEQRIREPQLAHQFEAEGTTGDHVIGQGGSAGFLFGSGSEHHDELLLEACELRAAEALLQHADRFIKLTEADPGSHVQGSGPGPEAEVGAFIGSGQLAQARIYAADVLQCPAVLLPVDEHRGDVSVALGPVVSAAGQLLGSLGAGGSCYA